MHPEIDANLSKADTAYHLLRRRILDGVYVGGYRLVIDELVRETGISGAPWREAVRRLEAEGWLEIVRNVGARLTAFSPDDFVQATEVVARLESYSLALASKRIDKATLARAHELNNEMRTALEDFDTARFADLHRDFHFLFSEHCGDEHVKKLVQTEWYRLVAIRRTVFSSHPMRPKLDLDEHENLLALIENDAPAEEIEAAARDHMRQRLERIEEHTNR